MGRSHRGTTQIAYSQLTACIECLPSDSSSAAPEWKLFLLPGLSPAALSLKDIRKRFSLSLRYTYYSEVSGDLQEYNEFLKLEVL